MTPGELRSHRTTCQEREVGVSYLRRLVQGHADILGAEMDRRRSGEEVGDLVRQLSDLLSDGPGDPLSVGRSRRSSSLPGEPEDLVPEELAEEWASMSAPLSRGLDGLSEALLTDLADALVDFERRLSDMRTALHERIDGVQAELVVRYRSGDADVSSLLEGR